jgi:hypothetical protein
VELLEDEPEPAAAQRGEAAVGQGATSWPATLDVRRRRAVEGAHDAEQVVLPEPDGPTMAVSSPLSMSRLTRSSAVTPRVGLRHVAQATGRGS